MEKRKNFGAKGVITPLPVLIIGTYDANGNPDAMNAAWGGQIGPKHIRIVLSKHKTTDNIVLKKAFTVAFADAKHVVESDYFGLVSANNVPDKIEKAGMHVVKSEFVDAPVIVEYPLTIECKLLSFEDDGNGGAVTGEIVNLSAAESVLDENGQIDLGKVAPIMYDSTLHYYRVVGDIVGKAFSDGNALK